MPATHHLDFIKPFEVDNHTESIVDALDKAAAYEGLCDDLLLTHAAHLRNYSGSELSSEGITELTLRIDEPGGNHIFVNMSYFQGDDLSALNPRTMIVEYDENGFSIRTHAYWKNEENRIVRRDSYDTPQFSNAYFSYIDLFHAIQKVRELGTDSQINAAHEVVDGITESNGNNQKNFALEKDMGINDQEVEVTEIAALRELLLRMEPWLPVQG